MIQPGELLDGYRTIRLIGSGGFGAVWLCRSEAVGDLRALKFVPILDEGRHDREFEALTRYRQSANQLRSPAIIPIEHVNRRDDGLFYIMPLCDGYGSEDPAHPDWRPTTLTAVLEGCRSAEVWLSAEQVLAYASPILKALQLLSDAGLVHRDVKPDNILFVNNVPCLADISLLGDDSFSITRRGTPGYSAPSWYVESGGHPDMYGAATTLYSLLTGNPPDKMGRSNFRWPPQGEKSLAPEARSAWLAMHATIRRAIDDRPAERFTDFDRFEEALFKCAQHSGHKLVEAAPGRSLPAFLREVKTKSRSSVLLVSLIFSGLLFVGFQTARLAYKGTAKVVQMYDHAVTALMVKKGVLKQGQAVPLESLNAYERSESSRIDIEEFERDLAAFTKTMTFPREQFSSEMDAIAADLYVHDEDNAVPKDTPRKPLSEIKNRFLTALKALPPKPDASARVKAVDELRAKAKQIGNKYGKGEREKLEERILKLDSELNTDADFRKEQGMKVLKRATKLVNSHPESHDIMRAAQNFSFAGTLE